METRTSVTISTKGGGFLRAALERQRVAVVDQFRSAIAKSARMHPRGDDEDYPDDDDEDEDVLL